MTNNRNSSSGPRRTYVPGRTPTTQSSLLRASEHWRTCGAEAGMGEVCLRRGHPSMEVRPHFILKQNGDDNGSPTGLHVCQKPSLTQKGLMGTSGLEWLGNLVTLYPCFSYTPNPSFTDLLCAWFQWNTRLLVYLLAYTASASRCVPSLNINLDNDREASPSCHSHVFLRANPYP